MPQTTQELKPFSSSDAAGADPQAALEFVLEAIRDAILILDRHWTFTFANRQAVELLHSGPLVGSNLWELFPGNAAEPFYSNYTKAMNERLPAEFEAFYPAPLNTWYRVAARPFGTDSIILFFSDISERKRAESGRDRSANLLAQVLDATNDGVLSLDRDWRFAYINRRGRELVGPDAELNGRTIWEIFPRTVGNEFEQNYRRCMDERVAIGFVAFYPAPLNTWFSVNALPSEDGITVFFRDITADHLAAEALRESERRYRVLADLNPQALWTGNPQGQITYANQGFLDYLGLEMADIHKWLEAFDPVDRDRVLAAWTHSVITGAEYDLEAHLIRGSDGTSRMWHLRGLPVRDDNGNIVQWLGVASDVHDSRSFAEVLRRQQLDTERQRAELEALYRTAPIGLAFFEPTEFRYVRLNNRQAAFFSLLPEQIIGSRVTDMAPIPGLHALFEQVAAGTPVINHLLEGELVTSPGEHRYWTVNYFPVYAADGSLHGISAASLEITAQKKAEAALMQSEKLAAVGRLASSISHEINNPLEAITNLLYLVAHSDALPSDLKVYVHMAQSELARVSQIATQTLRFHRQAVKPTMVTPAQLVNAVLNLYQGRLSNSGIHSDIRYDTDAPILCFENDIRQVLNNLIANAIDAMRTGGRLIVRAHTGIDHQTGRHGVRIVIADTGHGMSAATMGRLFEPFFTTKDLNGTGLGLWISKDIVDRHGGRLSVRSTQETIRKGTIFSLFLPEIEDPVA